MNCNVLFEMLGNNKRVINVKGVNEVLIRGGIINGFWGKVELWGGREKKF